jgi:release factor glutamine methyltransferase
LRGVPGGQELAVRLLDLPGMTRPSPASEALADALRRETLWEGARVLDVGTGSGIVAVTAALRGAAVTAVDTSRRALVAARINARLNGTQVRTVHGSLFDELERERFDCIAAHLPAGAEGDQLRERLVADAPEHLRPNGVLLLVAGGAERGREDLDRLAAAGFSADVAERRQAPDEVLVVRGQQKVGKSAQDGWDPLQGGALVP